jgi:PAS domain S-box-containing protein
MEAGGTFTRFGLKDGLPNEIIMGILEDDQGHLWISTGNGLARFTPATLAFKNFDIRDGLQSNEFNSMAFYRDRQGLLYFGGVDGFNVIDPAQIQDNQQPPAVVVTSFRIFNEPAQVDLSGASRLVVPYWQNFIAFEFSAFDYYAPQKIQYAYKLEGFDTDWVQAGTRRYASYTNLPGGDYIFHVKAANSDGVWNDTGISIPLTVTPPIWQNWWFQVGGLVLFVSLLVFGYSWRLRNIQTQTWNLEVQVAQRTDELRRSNELLAQEILQRQRAEEALARRAEEELQVSEARFRAVFDSAAIGIGILSLEQEVVDANPAMCRLLGLPREQVIGLKSAQATHPDDWAESSRLFEELLSGQRDSYLVERRYLRKNGDAFWAQVTMSLVRGSDGQPRFLVGMVIDIDEQKGAQEKLELQEREYRQHLEERVQERTLELSQTNEQLQQEMEQRRRAEDALTRKAAEEAVAAERTRLAHDLHDAVTQTLFSASLIAEVIPDLWKLNPEEALKSTDELRQLTRGALAEMRTLLLELRPAALTQTRFQDLLKQLTEALIGRTRLPITLSVEGDRRLPPEVQVALYRIAQESLNNIIKYARATQVNVSIAQSPAGIHMEIIDNGLGFDQATAKPTSLGLRIMRERAEAIGAEWCINSTPGNGTRVSVTWTAAAQGDL